MFRYDAAGRVVETEDAIAHVTKTQYDAEGRAVAVTDARGFVTKTRYDRAGRIVETEAADGGKTTLAYCADVGTEPCCAIDALGNITKKEFDAAGRVTKVTDALGQVAVTTYDTAGRMKSTSGPGQVPTTYGYGSNGLLSSMVQPLTTINYGYDVRGSRTTVEAHGQVTTFTYDLANRLLTETNPIGKVTSSFAYDPTGNRQTKTDGNGKVTTYSYDGNRRLTEVQFADDTKYEYAYDARGNRTLERSPSHTRTLAYDELGRLTTVDDVTLGRAIQYAYDELGNRISVQEGALLHAYAYDAMGRLKRATAPGAAAEFDYDAVGRRTLVSRSNGVVTNYGYDAVGQVLNIVHSTGGAVLASFAYQYDNGNRTVKEYADGTKEAYEYDGNDRLTRVAYGTSRVVSYNLDPLGNWNNLDDVEQSPQGRRSTFRSSTFNPFNQILSADTFCQGPPDVCPPGSATKYTYDGNGNLLAETTGPAVKRYEWDLDNRLRGVTHPSGTVSTYDYDANGLRTRKMEAGVTTRYLLDGPSVLEELDSSGGLMTGYLTNPQVIDEILSFTTGNAVYWPLSDALGSIYTVANSTGAVVRSYSYDVYGQRVSIGPGPSITFGFTGREHDAATALNYHRDRYKAPTSGRWTQPDRLGAAEGLNAYQYAGTNPVIFADPTGLCRDPGGPGVRFCISAFIPTTFLASRGNPFLKTGFGDSRGPDPTGGSFRIQQTIQLIGGTAIQQFEVAWSRGLPIPGITGALPLIGIPGTSPFNYANLSGGILDAIGTGHSEMAGLIANAGTITYEFQIPVDTRIIRFFCGRVPIVSGERTNYPSFEVWMYQDGAMPTLLYQYDAKMAGAAVEDLHSSTWIPGLGGR
jgi:RHS repeat-associated protein